MSLSYGDSRSVALIADKRIQTVKSCKLSKILPVACANEVLLRPIGSRRRA